VTRVGASTQRNRRNKPSLGGKGKRVVFTTLEISTKPNRVGSASESGCFALSLWCFLPFSSLPLSPSSFPLPSLPSLPPSQFTYIYTPPTFFDRKQRSSESDEKLSEKRKRKLGLKKKKRKRKAIETQGSLSCFFFVFLRLLLAQTRMLAKKTCNLPILSKQDFLFPCPNQT
jgi:hypothetical protein